MTDFVRDPDAIREDIRRWIGGDDRIEPPEPQGEPDPETDRDRFAGPLDRDDPPERPERPYFDQRDHFSDWGRP